MQLVTKRWRPFFAPDAAAAAAASAAYALIHCVAYRMYNRGDPASLEKSAKRNSWVSTWNEVVKNPS
jgi:hypothetical protein